ncbi:MAG: hypothetical protein LBR39_02565 [Coriobacteriales bacterium]|jgi:hypothetical protein|nr:hypothetical protein [Coriobacteriales bacterium]
MFNTIRADLYRLLHGKGLYICYALYLLGVAFIVFTGSTPAPRVVMENFLVMLCFILAIVYLICAPDFNHGVIKTPIASGASRSTLYLARLLLSFVLCELLYGLAVLLAIGLDLLLGYPLADPTVGSAAQLAAGFGCQSLMLLAACATGVAIAHIAQRGAVLNAVYVALFFGMTIFQAALGRIIPSLPNLDFVSGSAQLLYFGMFDSFEPIWRILAVGAVYLAASTVLGLAVFSKCEIK